MNVLNYGVERKTSWMIHDLDVRSASEHGDRYQADHAALTGLREFGDPSAAHMDAVVVIEPAKNSDVVPGLKGLKSEVPHGDRILKASRIRCA